MDVVQKPLYETAILGEHWSEGITYTLCPLIVSRRGSTPWVLMILWKPKPLLLTRMASARLFLSAVDVYGSDATA